MPAVPNHRDEDHETRTRGRARIRTTRPAGVAVTVDIRPWAEADVDWWVGLRREWDPSVSEDRLRELAAGQIARYVHRAVAWDRGERVGFAMISYLPGAA